MRACGGWERPEWEWEGVVVGNYRTGAVRNALDFAALRAEREQAEQ